MGLELVCAGLFVMLGMLGYSAMVSLEMRIKNKSRQGEPDGEGESKEAIEVGQRVESQAGGDLR